MLDAVKGGNMAQWLEGHWSNVKHTNSWDIDYVIDPRDRLSKDNNPGPK